MFVRKMIGVAFAFGTAFAGAAEVKQTEVKGALKVMKVQATLPAGEISKICAKDAEMTSSGYSDGLAESTDFQCSIRVKADEGKGVRLYQHMGDSGGASIEFSIGEEKATASAFWMDGNNSMQLVVRLPRTLRSGTTLSKSDARFVIASLLGEKEEKIRTSPEMIRVSVDVQE